MFCTGMLSVWFLQRSVPTLFNKRIRKHCIKWLFRGLLLYLLLALFCKPWFHSRAHSGCSNGLAFSRSQRSQFQIHLFSRALLFFLGQEGGWFHREGKELLSEIWTLFGGQYISWVQLLNMPKSFVWLVVPSILWLNSCAATLSKNEMCDATSWASVWYRILHS